MKERQWLDVDVEENRTECVAAYGDGYGAYNERYTVEIQKVELPTSGGGRGWDDRKKHRNLWVRLDCD